MRVLFTILVVLCSTSATFAQSISEQITRPATDIQGVFDSLRSDIIKFDRNIDAANTKIKTSSTPSTVTSATSDLEKQKSERLGAQYSRGTVIVTRLRDGVTLISFMESLVHLEQSMNATTNIWSDKQLRNSYDRLRDYGTVLGTALGAVAFFTNDGDQKRALGGAGLGLVSVSQLASRFFGKEHATRLQKQIEFIQLTRAAYDDLLVRKAHIEAFVKGNEKFEADVITFEAKYLADNATDDAKAKRVAELAEYLSQYDVVLRQIPELLQEITDVQIKYSDRLDLNPELKKVLETLKGQVASVRERYEAKVKPILDVPAEDRALLRQPFL